jgi:hypothetical protein
MTWYAYRAWMRACRLNAWRATRAHFGGPWRCATEILGPWFATTLALYVWGGEPDAARDHFVAISMGGAVSGAWISIVLGWNFGLAPYRLWLAAQARIEHLQIASGHRVDRHAVAQELEVCIKQGAALMESASPSQSQLAKWYEGVLRVVSHAGDGYRAMLESSGPPPGERGGPLELLILSNRIERLRLILDWQRSGQA